MRPKQWGFTLVEMAIVLMVVGLLLTGAVVGLKPALDSSRITTAGKKLQRIDLALQAYVMQNGCLPCPADPTLGSNDATGNAGWSQSDADYYGPGNTTANSGRPCAASAAAGAATCSAVMGVVPWNSLGLRDSDTSDPWGSRISYAVTSALTVTAGTSMARGTPASYPAGTLHVDNIAGDHQTTAAAYVLISHGPNQSGSRSAANGAAITGSQSGTVEAPNDSTTGVGTVGAPFLQDRAAVGTGASFDDIVTFKTAAILIQACGKNACGNPP